MPEVFQAATVPAVSPPSAIFREDGSIRWRIDNLVCETDADQLLADTFEKALEGSSRSENVRLLPGDVLVADNWYSLHAALISTTRIACSSRLGWCDVSTAIALCLLALQSSVAFVSTVVWVIGKLESCHTLI